MFSDPYEYIPSFAQHLDAMSRAMRGFDQARDLSAFLSGRRQLIQELERRVTEKRDELAKAEAATIDGAKAEAAKIIERAQTEAKAIGLEGYEASKRRLAEMDAQIAARRAELAGVESQIAALKQSAARFAAV